MTASHRRHLDDAPAVDRVETPGQRDARIHAEAAIIAQAEVDIDAGLGIDDDDLESWLDELERDENAPLPTGRALRPGR